MPATATRCGSRREWKDVEDLHHQRAEGRIGLDIISLVLEESARVIEILDADHRWWSAFDDWTPGNAPDSA